MTATLKAVKACWKHAEPPITSSEEFLLRDSLLLSLQLKCSITAIEEYKRIVASAVLFPPLQTGLEGLDITPLHHGLSETWCKLPDGIPSTTYRANPMHYPTGFSELDVTLGQGLPTGLFHCVFGDLQSGKTQVALHIASNMSLHGYRVLYIDTNNNLSMRRLHALINMRLVEMQLSDNTITNEMKNERLLAALGNIYIERVYDLWTLMNTLGKAQDVYDKHPEHGYHLIIVDCLHHLFAPYLVELTTSNEKFAPQSIAHHYTLPNVEEGGVASSHVNYQGVANVHPLIAQCMLHLRALVGKTAYHCLVEARLPDSQARHPESQMTPTTQPTQMEVDLASGMLSSVLVTNVCMGSSSGLIKRATTAVGRGSSSGGSGTSATAATASASTSAGASGGVAMTGGTAVYLDVFDVLISLSSLKTPHVQSEETLIRSECLHRPPYYKSCPLTALLRIPRFY
jgi:hypothetical protein